MKVDFSKGINTNTEPANTPPGYYRDAMNMRDSGGSMRSEEGNVSIEGVPSELLVWGSCPVEDDTIILASDGDYSVIGILHKEDGDILVSWTETLRLTGAEDCLGFSDFIQVEGKIDWKGDYIIYFSTEQNAWRLNLTQIADEGVENLCNQSKLFLDFSLPITEYYDTTNNGRVPSGTYQLAARFITASGAATSFGIPSGPIPVVDDLLTGFHDTIDGCPPQTPTNKSILVEIKNIDLNFQFIQLGVVTYIGDGNVVTVYTLDKEPITGSTMVTEFTGMNIEETITIEEFIVSNSSWKAFDYVTQKDNSLIVVGPKEKDQPEIDWYAVAKDVVVKPTIKALPVPTVPISLEVETDSIGPSNVKDISVKDVDNPLGYKDPANTAKYKGYRRGEVYVFTLTAVFSDGTSGPTVQIPADITGPEKGSSTQMGWFTSGYEYPMELYPEFPAGSRNLRFHRMPEGDVNGIPVLDTDGSHIQVLGIEVSNIIVPDEYKEQIAGYIIGRLDRIGNESVFSQGIVRPFSKVWRTDDSILDDDFEITLEDYFWPMCGIGDITVNMSAKLLNYGCGGPWGMVGGTDYRDYKHIDFVAPDIINKTYSPGSVSAFQHSHDFKAEYVDHDKCTFSSDTNHRSSCSLRTLVCDTIKPALNARNTAEPNRVTSPLSIPATGVYAQIYSKGGKRTYIASNGNKELHIGSTNGITWFELDEDIHFNSDMVLDADGDGATRVRIYQTQTTDTGGTRENNWIVAKGEFDLNIYNTIARNSRQYGIYNSMTSMLAGYVEEGESSKDIFGGDTFITKYGYSLMDEVGWEDFDTAEEDVAAGFLDPGGAGIVAYVWLESVNNYEYRHTIPGDIFSADTEDPSGSVDYYPKSKQIVNSGNTPYGVVGVSGPNTQLPGYPSLYNKQYSAQSNIKPYPVTSYEDITYSPSYNNRILYSSISVEGEKIDAYQLFMPNDYYDVPRTYGDLTNIFISQGELYSSTAQVIWKLFFNTMATQITNVGEVVLGTGGAFNRPAIPLATIEGGHGGVTHWTHLVSVLAGVIFVDKLSGMLFMLSGGQLQELTHSMDDNFKFYVQALSTDYLTNPMEDIKLGNDVIRNRVIIRVGLLVISYSLNKREFESRFSYTPRYMFSHGSRLYSQDIDTTATLYPGIFRVGIGKDCVFHGEPAAAYITVIVNPAKDQSKLFSTFAIIANKYKDIELLSSIKESGGLGYQDNIVPFEHFDKYEIWNRERYTGVVDIRNKTNMMDNAGVLEVLSDKIKDSYRMVVLGDIVIDPKIDKFLASNQAQVKSDTKKVSWLPRIRGTFIELKLIKDIEPLTKNTRGPIELISIEFNGSENKR